jgi:heme/copper-type cytochrome/quinol oxidase subunit 3
VSATTWPSGADVLSPPLALVNTALLLAGSAAAWRARGAAGERAVRRWLAASAAAGVVFLMVKALEYRHDVAAGLVPSASTFLAAYFTLTGLHAAHVVGGVVGNVWAGAGAAWLDDAQTAGRVRALSLYWGFVDVVWIVILVLFYLT